VSSWYTGRYVIECSIHCTVSHCTLLQCTVLHCTLLHCTLLHCTVLYCTVLYTVYLSVVRTLCWGFSGNGMCTVVLYSISSVCLQCLCSVMCPEYCAGRGLWWVISRRLCARGRRGASRNGCAVRPPLPIPQGVQGALHAPPFLSALTLPPPHLPFLSFRASFLSFFRFCKGFKVRYTIPPPTSVSSQCAQYCTHFWVHDSFIHSSLYSSPALYCTVLHCTVLSCTVLFCSALGGQECGCGGPRGRADVTVRTVLCMILGA